MSHRQSNIRAISLPARWFYLTVIFFLTLTGFGQMPIFKRYYIADIPGLGWLDRYYLTHTIHYLGAIALLMLIVYCIVVYWALLRKQYRLDTLGRVRIVFLAGIIGTGIFRVLKNLPDIVFSPQFTMYIDISHLACMMLYIVAVIVAMVSRQRWLRDL